MRKSRKGAHRIASTAVAAAMLAGCVANPQTADEFRKTASEGGRVTTFDVIRPFRDVAGAFRSKAPECLNATVREVHQTGTAMWMTVRVYKPTVLVNDKRAELQLRLHYEGLSIGQPPEGYYVFVADATPAGGGKTHVGIYSSTSYDNVTRAVTGWVTGKNIGCPDLSKN